MLPVCGFEKNTISSPVVSPQVASFKDELVCTPITQMKRIAEFTEPVSPDTLYLFDLDDVLMDSPSMLGSKAWRACLKEIEKKHPGKNWHDRISLFVAQNLPVVAVESDMSLLVKQLQAQGCLVFGFTAREREIWYDTPSPGIDLLTITQLQQVGIDFAKTTVEKPYSYLKGHSAYFSNIYFVDTDTKGEFVTKLLEKAPKLPKKVVFIDDKLSHGESVNEACAQLRMPHSSYCYTATDEKAKQFDPLIAHIQLYYLRKEGKVVSDKEALELAKNKPEKDAETYVQEILELFNS